MKANILDIFIIVFISMIATSAATYLFFPKLSQKLITGEAEWREVTVDVIVSTPFILEKMTKGDKQVGADGRVFVELLSLETKYDNNEKVSIARFKVLAKSWRGSLQFGNYTLIPGETFEFTCDKYKLWGTIYAVNNNK
ncbi:MAG: hypothetical protein A2W23_05190 [Planctomycetes bacterium RBG_16_43_13]|nr:MAG: hypothetical protein A2W23_05190 [Planctomycetes bacterium RBG_16_43_13]